MLAAPLLLGILLLLGVANGSPVLAATLLKERFNLPLDGGRKLPDGQPLFGSSKTIRGLLVSICSTTIVALVLGFEWSLGVGVAAGAMAGDLFSSFVKRRFRTAPHTQVFGLDQIPEALLPLLLFQDRLGLSWWDITVLLTAFSLSRSGSHASCFYLALAIGLTERPCLLLHSSRGAVTSSGQKARAGQPPSSMSAKRSGAPHIRLR